MNKLRNKPIGKYKSRLEKIAAELLEESGLEFKYEPWVVELKQPFVAKVKSYERIGKKKVYKLQSNKIKGITYTPDFVGVDWIIETKGVRTADFNIRWKLFKKYLLDNNLEYRLYMPGSKKEIVESIKLIKNETIDREDSSSSGVLLEKGVRGDKKPKKRKTSRGRNSIRRKMGSNSGIET